MAHKATVGERLLWIEGLERGASFLRAEAVGSSLEASRIATKSE